MARLTYTGIASLDGYVEDGEGRIEWGAPDEEVHSFVNELVRPAGTYLFGRHMYETMLYWETPPADEDTPDFAREFAEIWSAADKVVYSRTLAAPKSSRTRIERSFDPEEVRRLKVSAGRDLTIGGAELAGQALRHGLVDELQLLVVPVLLGDGKPWLPRHLGLDLELLESRRFSSGVVFLRYRPVLS